MAVAAVDDDDDDDAAKLLRDANVEVGTANEPPAVVGRLAVSAVPMLLRAAVAVADDAPMMDLRAAVEAADENAEPAMLFRTMPGLLAMPARMAAPLPLPVADAACALDDAGGAGSAGAEAAAAAAAAASARRCAASCTAAVTSYWLMAVSKCACLIASGESGVGRHESSSWCE